MGNTTHINRLLITRRYLTGSEIWLFMARPCGAIHRGASALPDNGTAHELRKVGSNFSMTPRTPGHNNRQRRRGYCCPSRSDERLRFW
ncbi:hypothetical protein J6590_003158 [Homalodisca vitripennis]|nr:hypothetical protein J6590_003158 [Homalodisca vitripennis]